MTGALFSLAACGQYRPQAAGISGGVRFIDAQEVFGMGITSGLTMFRHRSGGISADTVTSCGAIARYRLPAMPGLSMP